MSTYLEFEPIHDRMSIEQYALPDVCIVTGELVGLFKNGGLGTSMTGVAELLSAYGAKVTVLYTGRTGEDIDEWIEKYHRSGINLEILERNSFSPIFGPMAKIKWTNAWKIFEFLKSRKCVIIHFNDTQGEGTYCFLAKKFGIAFQDTLLTLALHSPMEWIFESNRETPRTPWVSACISGERISIALTDLLWAPSCYLLSWLVEKKYALPQKIYNQQYVIPTDKLFVPGRTKMDQQALIFANESKIKPREIIFFGRLEERKGIRLFTAAISVIHQELFRHQVSIVFMGKQCRIGNVSSQKYLEKQSEGWLCKWRIEDGFGQQEAISYLKGPNRLAVMASPVDNSPCTVYEALIHNIPFIAARAGGIPELIDPDYHHSHLFEYTLADLSRLIRAVLNDGIGVPKPAITVSENQLRWLNFHANWSGYVPAQKRHPIQKKNWAIYIDHSGDPEAIARTLASVESEFPEPKTLILIVVHDLSAIEQLYVGRAQIVDQLDDKSAAEILHEFFDSGATCLLSLRSGVELEAGSRVALENALEHEVDAIVPVVRIGETGALMPSLAGCAVLTWLEKNTDAGIVAARLDNKTLQSVMHRLGKSRLHLGLLEELHAVGATVWPYPEVIASVQQSRDLEVSIREEDRRLSAISSAPSKDIYQLISIALNYYPKTTYSLESEELEATEEGRIWAQFKSYVYSNPPLIRYIFNNRVVRKIAYVLSRVSRQQKA